MTNAFYHAASSARHFGGKPEDYQKIHDWFDETKSAYGDFRHRALRHHSFGIFECEKLFGVTIFNADGHPVPVRNVAEQHVVEDCGGRIPSVEDWLGTIQPAIWMARSTTTRHLTRRVRHEDF